MSQIKIEIHQVSMLSTNCYFLINKDSKECAIVDPGDNAKGLEEKIRRSGYTPVAILLTHGHFDHIMAVNKLKSVFNIPVYAFKEEEEMLKDTKERLFGMVEDESCLVVNADKLHTDGEVLDLIGTKIKVIHTPGHSKGSCCFYLEDEKILISGDTLFEGSIGRTDFEESGEEDMLISLEKLKRLDKDIAVYPGHGYPTSIGEELRSNPYLR